MDVSVIIPTYNRLWCLPRAVESCRNTQCKTEIIVVDDGSTDGTWEWLQNQKGLIAIRQKNQGQTYAINEGFKRASGKYIRFLDSDDFLTENTIDRQYEAALISNAQLIYSRVDQFDYETKKVFKVYPDTPLWEDFIEVQLSNQYGSHFLGMLFHRELVEKVPRRPDFALREDRMFLLEVGMLDPKIETISGCAGYWVRHSIQMQGNYDGMRSVVANWQHCHIFKRILRELENQGKLTPKRKNAACTTLWTLAHWIAKTHLSDAVNVVNWIHELNPDFQIPEKGFLGMLYRKIGFKHTEQLLSVRRFLKYGWR